MRPIVRSAKCQPGRGGKLTQIRPLIGITTSEVRPLEYANPAPKQEPFRAEMALGMTYTNALERAGALPVVLPPLPEAAIEPLLDRIDGVCLSGGPDVDPAEYGAERDPRLGPTWRRLDRFELALARAADGRRTPMLGICRGAQVLNVARGGDLVQHLDGDGDGDSPLHHRQRVPGERQSHAIEIEPRSRLAEAVGATELEVNSFHHQAIRTLGRGLHATAHAPDGVIEAIEDPEAELYLGVQWHAEFDAGRETGIALLGSLVEAAARSAAHV
jgi:putative glutamine amidotransferase